MKRAFIPVVCLGVLMMAGPVSSTVLTLDCRVRSTKPGYHQMGVRRLAIDLVAKTVRVSDNTGRGFQVRGTRPLVSADGGKYVLENGGGKTAFVDRHSGRYYFHNDAEKLVIEGRCMPAAP